MLAAGLFGQTLSLGTPATPATPAAPTYTPPTANDRLQWFAYNTAGPPTLIGGVVSAAWGTLFNSPSEYGPHWDGFAKRYGMRLTGVATGNAIEAGLGSLWGEDPRYFRVAGQPFKTRIGHVFKMAVLANRRDGGVMPAYARYTGMAGNNLLSNTWRADSEATASRAALRIGLGFLGRIGGNAFIEFWPDLKTHTFRSRAGFQPAAGF